MLLYRQGSAFARAYLALASFTLAEGVGACGTYLHSLVNALKYQAWRHSLRLPLRSDGLPAR